jgi:alpha-tubulin suppressor-like RCC1 family protein
MMVAVRRHDVRVLARPGSACVPGSAVGLGRALAEPEWVRPGTTDGASGWATVSAASVTAGGMHTCATRTHGTARCWGLNCYGVLGGGTTTERHRPVKVFGGAAMWATVSGGHYHICATGKDGSAWCWGRDRWGELGDGGTVQADPVLVR